MAEPETMNEQAKVGSKHVPIDLIHPNPRNPRRHFGEEDLADLAQSIREKGVVQPILVRSAPGRVNHFEIIAGERRWRASQRAGHHEIPVIVRDVSDKEALELAIIENVQRADLDPIEEAVGYEQLIADFGYTQQDLGQVIGKSRSHVANTLRLLKLPETVKEHLRRGELTAGHARALVTATDPASLAEKIVTQGLTVRDAEALAQSPAAGETPKPAKAKKAKDADTIALEKTLSDLLGLWVAIDHKADGTGRLEIKYRTLDQLDDLVRRLKVG
ncbi:MAG: ParB/RepB/Spo0J family partition protein [Hyphomicrobiales bacterium]|nr:ParB/RepB/Spo0J family partition protein [Hyphomicrobiales bacterium]